MVQSARRLKRLELRFSSIKYREGAFIRGHGRYVRCWSELSRQCSTVDLVSSYNQYFKVQRAVTPELIQEALRIRFEVYCKEFKFEDVGQHRDGMEKDAYDAFSNHCLLYHKASASYVGCVRLVQANPLDPQALFPFEEHCGHVLRREVIDPATMRRESTGEISRLAVRQKFRRRRGEAVHPDGFAAVVNPVYQPDRRQVPQMVLGLYLAAAAIGLSNGLESVFAMMELRLARHLSLAGIKFTQVGDVIDYRGSRAAFHITRQGLYQHLKPEVRALLETITSDLATPTSVSQGHDKHAA